MWFWASAICVTYVFTFWHVGCFCEHVEMLGCTMMQPLPLKKGCQACSRNQFSILEVMNLSFHSGWSPGDTDILRCFWCIFTSLHMSYVFMFHSTKRCQCGLHPQIQDSLWSPFPTSNSGPSGPQLLHNILGDLENPKKRRVKKASAKGWDPAGWIPSKSSNLWAWGSCEPHSPEIFTGWCFGTFFIFPFIGNNHPNWLIFFREIETTNQECYFD